jgi:tRNA (guanosine-2'-O-)-methyltransferase
MFIKKLSKGCVKYATSGRFLSSSTNEWSNWEYGTFQVLENSRTEAERCKTSPDVKGRYRNVDQFWRQLTDSEIELGITTLKPFCNTDRFDKFLEVIHKRTTNVRIVFENPQNPNNLWAALRTFDSFGVQFVDVVVNENSYHKQFKQKTMVQAMGTQKWLTLTQHDDIKVCLEKLKQDGYRVVAADLHSSSIPLQDINWGSTDSDDSTSSQSAVKIAIVMGTEERGISAECRAMADDLFHIPMRGFAESFNVSAASAVVCAFAEAKGALRTPLEPLDQRRLLLTWLTRSVHAGMPLLRQAGLPLVNNHGTRNAPYEMICGVSTKS